LSRNAQIITLHGMDVILINILDRQPSDPCKEVHPNFG
jgi:hypothetical protein